MKIIYLVECGVLLDKAHKEYEYYSQVYDKKHGFYDETQFMTTSKDFGINYINEYVESGVVNTYGILTEQVIDSDSVYDELVEEEKENPYLELIEFGAYETYDMLSVLYDVYKKDKNTIIGLFDEVE